MTAIYSILLLLLAVGPVYLAWSRGDTILNSLDSRRRRRRMMARLRSTRRLPVREDVLQRLMKGDARLDQLEQQIADSLQQLSRLPHPSTSNRLVDAAKVVQSMEAPLLTRESHFNTYLDAAWLQSETIDVLDREIELLREVAGLSRDWPDLEAAGEKPSEAETPAAEKLKNSLREVARRRQSLDQRLRSIGNEEPGRQPS